MNNSEYYEPAMANAHKSKVEELGEPISEEEYNQYRNQGIEER